MNESLLKAIGSLDVGAKLAQDESLLKAIGSLDVGAKLAQNESLLKAIGSLDVGAKLAEQFAGLTSAIQRLDFAAAFTAQEGLLTALGKLDSTLEMGDEVAVLALLDVLAKDPSSEAEPHLRSDDLRKLAVAYAFVLVFCILTQWYLVHPEAAALVLDLVGLGSIAVAAAKVLNQVLSSVERHDEGD